MSAHSHHWPLVTFTSLAIAGAGTVAADSLLTVAGGPRETALSGLGAALMLAGLMTSLLHLGRPARLLQAVRRVGGSPLSNEVVLASLALAAAIASCMAGIGYLWVPFAVWLSGGSAALFLVSIGLVYGTGGQLTWRGASVLTPLSGGLACGVGVVEGLGQTAGVSAVSMLVLLADAAIFMLRWRRVTSLAVAGHEGEHPWFDRRHELLLTRFLLLDAIPFVLLSASPSLLVPLVAMAGLVADRVGFYTLGVQHTTERELAAVEQAIERTAPPRQM
ncbi:MAG: DmsC/YnfH family molybdoenzyme membrane anchor subunit [Acidobacteriota bacterium]